MTEELFGGQAVMQIDDPRDRRAFIKYAAMFGGVSLLAACGTTSSNTSSNTSSGTSPTAGASPSPSVDSSTGDLGILNYALTLEYLEAEFYQKGVAANILGSAQPLIDPIAQHEAAHVAALTAAITQAGGKPVAKPTFNFPATTFTDKATFLKTAQTFEETGVKAYQGQVTKIVSKDVLGAAASIAGVESRHAAIINDILSAKQVPAAFEANAPMSDILAAVKPFIAGS
ncbi:MAG: ferritin-like domain-containing protein [Candidatus Dormibacteria bacterium]